MPSSVQEKIVEELDWKTGMGLNDDPNVGSTIYLQINDLFPDPNNTMKKINIGKMLSVFPGAIHGGTGEKLAGDVGFDSDEHADKLRRLIYLGANAPETLSKEEKDRLKKILIDNKQYEKMEDIYKMYDQKRVEYFHKRAATA